MKSTNIVKQEYKITSAERQKLNKHGSYIIWFTGLSGSGKSTVANLVENKLHSLGIRTYVLV